MTGRCRKLDGRHPDALLAGVCARIASTLSWNVWVLRVLFVGFLALKTLWALGLYAVLAIVLHLLEDGKQKAGDKDRLGSPELASRNQRIEELERQFRDLEQR